MTARQYTPRAFAPKVNAFLSGKPRCALWAKPGMGKTVLVLTHLDVRYNVIGEDRPTLVLAPLRVARDTWTDEVAKWDHLRGLEVAAATGGVKERTAALKRDVPVHTLNYENLMWLREHFASTGRAWPYARVIADESTKLKGFRSRQGGKRAQALAQFAHADVSEWVNLTGTPSPNGLKDLWGQTWFIDAGESLGRTYSAFESRWFGYKRAKDAVSGRLEIKPVIFPHAQDEIMSRLSGMCLSLDPKDYFDLAEPVVTTINITLPPTARALYRELEKELFVELTSGEGVEVFSAGALSNKCLQLANGAVYLDSKEYGEGAFRPVHDEKLDALSDLAEETGGDRLLVCYQFKSDLARLRQRFPDALVLAQADHLAAAKRGEGKLWLAHPASMGHGVDGLQNHCHTVVFYAQDWNLEYHDQVLERVGPMRQLQAGTGKPVFLYYLVAKGTTEVAVVARRQGKTSVQDALFNYMKEST